MKKMRADILKNVNAHKTLHDISYGCLLWRKDYMHYKGHLSITPKKTKKSRSMCMGNRKGHMKTIRIVVII
jgi:hypothetical protein